MIYAVGAVGTEFVKFGYADDMRRRLGGLQIGCPYELEVLAVCTGDQAKERLIHLRLKAAGVHIRGEWFKHGPETQTVIQEMLAEGHKTPRLAYSKAKRRKDAQAEQRTAGGWKIESRAKRHKPIVWAEWLKRWEERAKNGKTSQTLSLAHARVDGCRQGRFSTAIARARIAEREVILPLCGNDEKPNEISGAISAAPL